MGTAGPTTRSALTLFEFFLRPANTSLASDILLCIVNPADEFVASERRDVLPRIERGSVNQQRTSQIGRKFVDDSAWNSLRAHGPRLTAMHIQSRVCT